MKGAELMAKRDNLDQRSVELMKGVYEWWQGQEMGENVSYILGMTRTMRKGVFRVELCVYDNTRGDDMVPVVKYAREWPNSEVQGLEACIFAMTLQVDRMVSDWVLDRQKPLPSPE